ncbi:MAG: hypothetical protein ACREOQ_07745 [Gemmatimonadales bacterium]
MPALLPLFTIQIAALSGAAPAPHTPVLAAVEIQRNDIFDPDEASGWVARLANWLHIRTRESVVRREVLLAPGMPFDSARAEETARNLRGLGIFRRVRLDTATTDSGLVARVLTKDAWSTQLDFGFHSTGNKVLYSLEVREQNLLGTGTTLQVQSRRDLDVTSRLAHFSGSRLIAQRVGLDLEYRDRSDGYSDLIALSAPFVSQATPMEFAIAFGQSRDTVRRYRNGAPTPVERAGRILDEAHARWQWAVHRGSRGYFRVGVRAQALRLAPAPATGRVMGQGGVLVAASRTHFLVMPGYRRFDRDDDVDLSSTVLAGLSYAPGALGSPADAVIPTLMARTGARVPGGFMQVVAEARGFYPSAGLDSGLVAVSLTAAFRPAARHLLVLHGEQGWRRHPPVGDDFDLGLDRGPRGYDAHAFTGDRLVFATAEWRWVVASELAGFLGIGLATFADYGGAWFAGDPRRTGASVGAGLRLDFTRSGDPSLVRIDLAHRFDGAGEPAGWVLVVGKGFAFSTAP